MIRAWNTALLFVVPGILAGAPGRVNAQEPGGGDSVQVRRISLAQALERLEAGNLELRLERQEVAAAQARRVSAGAFPNPGFAATREQLSGDAGDANETLLALSQRFEIGGQRGARRRAAQRGADASEARLDAARLRLAFQVHEAYVRAAVAEADLSVVGEATAVFRRVEESGGARFAEGDISRFDRSRLQVERARYETLLARTRLELDEAARDLALLVAPDSLAVAAVLLPAASLTELGTVRDAPALAAALAAAARRADVRAAEAEVEAARAQLSLASRERIPDVTLSAGYKEETGGVSGAVFGLSVPVPLWNRNQGGMAEARAGVDAALVRREMALARARTEIRRAWDTYRSLHERMRTLDEMLLAASAGMLETARIAWAEGEMSLVELLDAADAYRSARASVNRLQGDHLIALYDLRRATGRLVESPSTPGDAPAR
ncbi:MAG: TolC family protein [Gemmatimonadota bacterium]|nr:TolC family protein [Gemmatimonadota bacterium]